MKAELTPEQLVDKAYQLRSAREKINKLLDACDAKLIALGKGDHIGSVASRVVKVIIPSAPEPGYKLEEPNEARARKIAGQMFGELFTRKISFTPCKAFAAVAVKLLTPARFQKLDTLCRVTRDTQSPYVKLS